MDDLETVLQSNHLLMLTGAATRSKLLPHFETVEMVVDDVIAGPDIPTLHVYFPLDGIVSVATIAPGGAERIETGNIGYEGMTSSHVVHGVDAAPQVSFVQVAGGALRIAVPALRSVMESDPAFRSILMRYAHVIHMQTAFTALANGRHTIEERLARWLLMSHDRLRRDDLPLKHSFLSLMLGVRRSGVTNSVHVLEGAGIIKGSRGNIAVIDRARLEEAAGDSYGGAEAEYARVMESPT